VEEVLLAHPAVGEAAVIAVPHPDGVSAAVAIAHARAGNEIDAEECLRWANSRLPAGSQLEKVVVVPPAEIPRGLTGKVLKVDLRERYASC